MKKTNRKQDLLKLFKDTDNAQQILVDRLIDEVVFLESKMSELKKMPFIKVHPANPEIQKSTPAAKQYKECMQSYMNAVRILLSILKQSNTSEEDTLLNMLKEFE